MKRVAFALALLAGPVMAQPETVKVDGQETLSGLWKISFPAGASGYMPGRGRLYSAAMESFCRLQQMGQSVSAICLPGWGPDSGGELGGGTLHLAWGIALARTVIDAKIETASVRAFEGDFALKIFGIRHDAPTPASARKLVLDSTAPDTAGKARLLTRTLEELATGAIATPHAADVALNFGRQMGNNKANTPEEIRSLGKVEAVLYLGEGSAPHGRFSDEDTARRSVAIPGFAFSAYQVEFTNGQRLCGIHERQDGVLDGFLCV
jgi:hypothetical protein